MFLMQSLFVVSLYLWAFCTFESVCILCICVYHISAPSFKIVSSNPLWSESLSLSISAVIGWELGTRQTSHPSFSGTFFISFFFAALFNNHVSFCGYYTSFSSLWALVCIPFLYFCHFGVIPYLWWFCCVILSFGLFWRVFQCVCRCYSWVFWWISLTGFCHLFGFIIILLFMFWDLFVSLCMLLLSRCHYIRCCHVTSCFIWFVLCVSCVDFFCCVAHIEKCFVH